jgi:hypothetical protein
MGLAAHGSAFNMHCVAFLRADKDGIWRRFDNPLFSANSLAFDYTSQADAMALELTKQTAFLYFRDAGPGRLVTLAQLKAYPVLTDEMKVLGVKITLRPKHPFKFIPGANNYHPTDFEQLEMRVIRSFLSK